MTSSPPADTLLPTFAAGLSVNLHARLLAEITSLRLAPGTALREVPLGRRFGVSRTPVREALQQLLRDGLVERRGRSYRVISLTVTEVQEVCEVREALECMAIGLAVPRDPGLAPALEALTAEQEAALGREELEEFSLLDGAFHRRIADGAGNGSLAQHLATLHDKVALVRGMEHRRPHWGERVLQEHRRIADAVRRGDAAIAAAELRYHIRSVVSLRPQPGGEARP